LTQKGVQEMAKQDSRTALRLPTDQRQKIEELIRAGKFQNLSEVVRAALQEFLSKEVQN
jgi:Arc/MetJ-type ribon-helix-helix transcriptional regulator